jgi:hypothetical protein
MPDQEITCRECRCTFVFSEYDQVFFAKREFQTPTRCKPCREKRKAEKEASGSKLNPGSSVMTTAVKLDAARDHFRAAGRTVIVEMIPQRVASTNKAVRGRNSNQRSNRRQSSAYDD